MRSRVKVSTEKLLAAVRARRKDLIAQHERDLKAYDARAAKVGPKVATALRAAADAAERGDFPHARYGGRELCVRVPFDIPTKPGARADTYRIDRLIRTLEMVTDPSMSHQRRRRGAVPRLTSPEGQGITVP